MPVHWNKWSGETSSFSVSFPSSTDCSGGMFRMLALPHLCFGDCFTIHTASQRDTWMQEVQKHISFLFCKRNWIKIHKISWEFGLGFLFVFCCLGFFPPAKILLAFIANQSLFLERSDFPVECKVLAASDMLSWPWLLSPCLHLETGSQFVAIGTDAKEVTMKTCRNQSL